MNAKRQTARNAFAEWLLQSVFDATAPLTPQQRHALRWSKDSPIVLQWWGQCNHHERLQLQRIPEWLKKIQ